MDLILSSGFLAFARHIGAVEAALGEGIPIDAVVGTSSGALVGALFQSGLPLNEISRLLSEHPPIRYMRPNARPWEGAFTMSPLLAVLRRILPESFGDLRGPLAVGVRNETGQHQLLHEGDVVSAVMASIAIPYVFPPVIRDGHRYVDGGVTDRTGVTAWRDWRPRHQAIVHVVDRSRGRDTTFDVTNTTVVRTPRSRAKFWSLGKFEEQRREARVMVRKQLAGLLGR